MGRWTKLPQRCATCSRVTLGAGVLLLTLLIGAVLLGFTWGFCLK